MFLSPRVLLLIALGALALLAPSVVQGDDEVVIEKNGLKPPLLNTTTAHRVTFINRSGRMAHVEFTGDPGEHKVFQVPGQIWAVFHRPGRHPYVVHLGTGRDVVTLRGAVEVTQDPSGTADLPTCDSVTLEGQTIMGECFVY